MVTWFKKKKRKKIELTSNILVDQMKADDSHQGQVEVDPFSLGYVDFEKPVQNLGQIILYTRFLVHLKKSSLDT